MKDFSKKLGITTGNYYIKGTKTVDYEKMKSHGYDYADFSGLTGTPGGFLDLRDGEFEKALLAEKARADAAGISFSQVHGIWPTDDTTEEKRKITLEKSKKAVRGAAVIDGKYLVVHPIMPYGCNGTENADIAEEINEGFFRELCEYAKGYGIGICLENMPFKTQRISRIAKIAEFVKRLDIDNLFICLDTGHVNVFREDIAEAVRVCGDRLKTLHVHDNLGGDHHLWPGMGNIKWKDFVGALRECGYDGAFSSEAHASAGVPEKLRDKTLSLHAEVLRSIAEL